MAVDLFPGDGDISEHSLCVCLCGVLSTITHGFVFAEEQTTAQRGAVTGPEPHVYSASELGFEPRST